MDFFAWATLAIALAGLGLSIFNAWEQRRTRTPQLRVVARYTDESLLSGELVAFLVVEATNIGDVPAILTGLQVIVDGKELVPEAIDENEDSFARPVEPLMPGQSYRQRRPIDRLAHMAAKRGINGTVYLLAF